MSVGNLGTPTLARSATGAVTGTWGTGTGAQPRYAGDMLVAIVTAGGSTATAAAISTPSGWTQVVSAGNTTGTANAWVAAYIKVAAGNDAAPAFTATLSGTVAMTCTLLELPAACCEFPVDAYGTYSSGGSSGTLSAMTAATGTNVSAAGGYAIGAFVQERAATTATWTGGAGWTNVATDGATSSVMHTAVDVKAGPAFNAPAAETGYWGTNTTAFGAGLVLVIAPQAGGYEVYTDNATTVIGSGGTDAPAAGTPEYWSASWAGFPAASNTSFPPTRFHVNDPLVPGEVIAVLNTATGLVIRGANGTVPGVHGTGFTVQNVFTAESNGNTPQVYSFRQYGAAGDGVTDDFAAIQGALTACRLSGGGTVHAEAGTYITSQIPQIGSNTHLEGDGPGATTIRAISGMNPVQIGALCGITALQVWNEAPASSILIENITFDGNEAGNTSITSPFSAAYSAAVRLDNADKIKLRNVEVINAISYSVWLNNATHFEVSGCRILSGQNTGLGYSGQDGLHITNSQTGVIDVNNIDTGTSSTTGGDAICLQSLTVSSSGGSAVGGGGPDPTASIAVTGNVIRAAGRGISMLYGGAAVSGITITGNDIWETQAEAVIAAWDTTGSGVHQGITITGNDFGNIAAGGTSNGITLMCPGQITSSTAPGWADVGITGNTFTEFTAGAHYGIYAPGGSGLNVSGNIFDGWNAGIGIQAGDNYAGSSQPVTGFTISANTVNMTTAATAAAAGITLIDSSNGSVAGNALTGNSNASSNGIILGGVSAANLTSGITVTGNSLTDWAYGVAEANYGGMRTTAPDFNTILDNNCHGCTVATVALGGHTLCQQGIADIGGVADTEQFTFLANAYTLTSSTSAQQIFNSTSNGTLTVPAAATFFFECEFDLTSLSASSGTFSFGFGGTATFSSLKYVSTATSAAAGTLATWQSAVVTTASATALIAASTTTNGAARLSGIMRTLAAGTVIPQVTLSVAAAAVVGANSWIRLWPAGASGTTYAGNWS